MVWCFFAPQRVKIQLPERGHPAGFKLMDEAERLSALIGDIYDAALEPSLWLKVLQDAAGFVGGPAASVFSKAVVNKSGQVFHQYGLDPGYVRLYFEKYIKLDPSTNSQIFAGVGELSPLRIL